MACGSATTLPSSEEGVFDKAVAAIKAAKAAGFKVTTNTTFFTQDSPKTVREVLDFLNDDLEVDEMMISPAYAYEKAPDQEHFLGVHRDTKLFKRGIRRRATQAVASESQPAVPRFLKGKAEFDCTAWGMPSYSLFGWQRPLLPDVRRLHQRPTKSCLRRPTGASTGAARTHVAKTAWRTAVTSRQPC